MARAWNAFSRSTARWWIRCRSCARGVCAGQSSITCATAAASLRASPNVRKANSAKSKRGSVSATPEAFPFFPLQIRTNATILRAPFWSGSRVVPREIPTEAIIYASEPLDEAVPIARVPATPFAFIWFLIRSHFRRRVAAMAGLALVATSIEAFSPVAFSHLVNSIAAAVKSHGDFALVMPWILWLAAIWFGAACAYRGYEMVDVNTGPRMRGLAQKYLFTYLLGHSPRYFQDNFAGKLGQKVKQAGQATIGIVGIVCFDMVRVTGAIIIGGAIMFNTRPDYAIVLVLWALLYLGVVLMLTKRCVQLSKALSDEVSTRSEEHTSELQSHVNLVCRLL